MQGGDLAWSLVSGACDGRASIEMTEHYRALCGIAVLTLLGTGLLAGLLYHLG